MFFIFIDHHNGNKRQREEIKKLLETNVTAARNKLTTLITEHDLIKQQITDDNTINTDNRALHHAEVHMEAADIEPTQKEAAIKALEEVT